MKTYSNEMPHGSLNDLTPNEYAAKAVWIFHAIVYHLFQYKVYQYFS